MKIVINSLDFKGSLVNGPGIRSLIFMQGCDRMCEGCHNTSTWDISEGTPYEISDLIGIVKERCLNRKITITGGEPLYQKEALMELIRGLDGFNICLYTSYEKEDVPVEILNRINYLKVGKYDSRCRTTTTPYYGSKNQKFITINEE